MCVCLTSTLFLPLSFLSLSVHHVSIESEVCCLFPKDLTPEPEVTTATLILHLQDNHWHQNVVVEYWGIYSIQNKLIFIHVISLSDLIKLSGCFPVIFLMSQNPRPTVDRTAHCRSGWSVFPDDALRPLIHSWLEIHSLPHSHTIEWRQSLFATTTNKLLITSSYEGNFLSFLYWDTICLETSSSQTCQ